MRRLALLLLFLAVAADAKNMHSGLPITSPVVTLGGMMRDAGAAYPLKTTSTAFTTSLAVTSVSTAASSTLLVLTVALVDFDGISMEPTSVSSLTGCAGWSLRISSGSDGAHRGEVWTNACSSTLSGQTVTVSWTNNVSGHGQSGALALDALTGTNASPIGNSAGADASTNSALNITVSGVASKSWVYVACAAEDTSGPGVVSGTTQIASSVDTSTEALVGVNTVGTGGSVNVGWNLSTSFTSIAALEIKSQ